MGAAYMYSTDEDEFIASKLKNITKRTPSSKMVNNTVFVYLDVYQLLGVDEKEGTINLKLWLYVSYRLPNIVWDPATNGIYGFSLPRRTGKYYVKSL